MHYLKTLLLALCATFFVASTGFADDYKIGDIVIEHPFSRATPPKARVAGGYMTVTNNGTVSDRLVSGSGTISKRIEIHEMSVENDIMRMRPLADGVEIPAGETVTFKPGSYHIMFMGINEPFKEGARKTITLKFEKAGEIEIEFAVGGMNAGASDGMKHDGMKHGNEPQHKDHTTN